MLTLGLFKREASMRNCLVVATFAIASLFAGQAMAGHVQNISKQSALSMCKDHGGGTTCGYCDGNHCHEVDCGEGGNGKCHNTVVNAGKVPSSGHPVKTGGGTAISGTQGTKNNSPPNTVAGANQPVISSGHKR